MDMHESARTTRLRERPPRWPRRHEDGPDNERAAPRRRDREREPFEDGALPELYPGALVMDDMIVTDDEVATLRVLARYTVARLLLLCLSGALAGRKLREERHIALEHLALLPAYDWERRALERLAMLCREAPARELVEAATSAAEAAAKRSHVMGAFCLYRAGYELALAEQWWDEAAQVARGIAQLARLEEARCSIRLWRRRAAILERRADRALFAAAAAAAAAATAGRDSAAGEQATAAGENAREIAERRTPTGEQGVSAVENASEFADPGTPITGPDTAAGSEAGLPAEPPFPGAEKHDGS